MRFRLVLAFPILLATCQSLFDGLPTQTNKVNDANKQKHAIKHSKQPEQIQLSQEQTKRQDLQKEALFQNVNLNNKEDSKKQELILKFPQLMDKINKQIDPPKKSKQILLLEDQPKKEELAKIDEIAKPRSLEVGRSDGVGFQERESETSFHKIIKIKILQKKGEIKVSSAEKDIKLSNMAKLTVNPPAASLSNDNPKPRSATKITKLPSTSLLLYFLYLGLPAAILLLLAIFLAAYFYPPNSDVVQVHSWTFLCKYKTSFDLLRCKKQKKNSRSV